MKKYWLIIFITLLLATTFTQSASAAFPRLRDIELIPSECREGQGQDCNLDSFLQMFINFSQLLLATLTIFTLLIFVWNSFGLAGSMGNPEKIKGAKSAMVGAVFGLVIVLSAWALTNTLVCLLVQNPANPQCEIFERPWWGYGKTACTELEPYRSGDCSGSGNYQLNCSDGPNDSFGTMVKTIQARLILKSCPVASADGCFSPETEIAVKIFQISNGLTVDGIAGPETLAALFSDSSPNCVPNAVPENENVCCVPYNTTLTCYGNEVCAGDLKDGNCSNYPNDCTLGCCYRGGPPVSDCINMRQRGCTASGKTWMGATCFYVDGCY